MSLLGAGQSIGFVMLQFIRQGVNYLSIHGFKHLFDLLSLVVSSVS